MTDTAVFLSCARVDAARADRLQRILESGGIRVEREDAAAGAPVFLACFSADGLFRDRPYQYEQFSRAAGDLIPVRFDDCEVPPWSCEDGRLLNAVPAVDVFDARFSDGAAAVAARVREVPGPEAAPAAGPAAAAGPAPAAPAVPATSGEALVRRVRNVRFSTTRLRPGYDEREVDDLLDRIVADTIDVAMYIDLLEMAAAEAERTGQDISAAAAETTWSPVLTPEEIRNKRFSTTRLRPGYAMEDVDAFLEEAAAALGQLTAAREDLRARLSR